MNLVIFATAANLDGVGAFLRETSIRQQAPVNGCLCVMYSMSIPPASISTLVQPLAGIFSALVATPCNINEGFPEEGQVSTLFAKFYLNHYTRYPGAWLVVDDWALPRENDFMQLLDRQHQTYGALVTGRAVLDPGSAVPVGPVVIGAPAKQIDFLKYATRDSWRQRGQYYFGRLNFGQVPPEEYLFTISSRQSERPVSPPPEAVVDQIAIPRKEPSRANDTDMKFVNPALVTPRDPAVAELPLDREFLMQGLDSFAPINADITHPPVASTHVFTAADFADKKALLAEVERVTGSRPHHFTGEAKLLEMLNTAPTP